MAKVFAPQEAIEKSLCDLKTLCEQEYHINLDLLIKDLRSTDAVKFEFAMNRFIRLLGVQIKQNFGDATDIQLSQRTGAYRKWIWNSGKIQDSGADNYWQYQTLQSVWKNDSRSGLDFNNYIESIARESELAWKLLDSIKQYICQDEGKREMIYQIHTQALLKAGPTSSWTELIPATGATIYGIISASIPHGVFLGPWLGGATILLLIVGIEALCWHVTRSSTYSATRDFESE